MADWRTVAIPERMAHLPRDPQGRPYPYILQRGRDGVPLFTVNDTARVLRCFRHDLCSICGRPLFRGRWFVGGPLSALHPHGAFNDPPMHAECVRYALRVCPHLAAPRYTQVGVMERLGPDALAAQVPAGVALRDTTMIPGRPVLFVAVMAVGQAMSTDHLGHPTVVPKRPYRMVEFWRHGEQLPHDEGMAAAQAALAAYEEAEHG